MDSDEKAALPRINDLDTVPPPDGGDAYGNATVVRAAPSDILDAIRRERATESGNRSPSETGRAAPSALMARLERATDEISDIPLEPSDVGPFAGAELEVDEAPIGPPPPLSAAALRPARVPADFDKLMSQRTEASVAAMSAQQHIAEPAPLAPPPKKRSQAVITVVIVVLVVWMAVLGAVTVAHFASR